MSEATGLERYRYTYGKRRDGKGYDVLCIQDGRIETFGPYRLQRDARAAICTGEIDAAMRERLAEVAA